jgi:hypothetical protein
MHSRSIIGIAAALFVGGFVVMKADDHPGGPPRVPAAAIAWQYNGRVNPATQTVLVYFTEIYGLTQDDLFNGAPSVSTARFTLVAKTQSVPVQPNGTGLQSFLVQPGVFTVYFTPNPSGRTWTEASFAPANGVVAVFSRTLDQQTVMGPFGPSGFPVPESISVNNATGTLKSSVPFVINNKMFDFGRVVPNGVTNVTTGPNVPQDDGSLPFAGFGLAVGNN